MSRAPPTVTAAPRATLRRRRRLLFVVLAVLLVWLVGELAAALGWWQLTGAPFSWGRGDAARAAASGEVDAAALDPDQAAAIAARRAMVAGFALHPFLGYAFEPGTAVTVNLPVSRYGFVDKAPPLRRRSADQFIVGVTGGSVAMQMCLYAEATLAAELAASPRVQGRRVEIVQLALSGYRQPQQLFAVQYAMMLGGEFDLLIDLDGFNELATVSENLDAGVPVFYPAHWSHLLDAMPSREQQLRLGELAYLREQRQALAAGAGGFRWSAIAQLIWLVRDRRLDRAIEGLAATIERAKVAPSFAITGPGNGSTTLAQGWEQMAQVWEQCSRCLHAACAQHDVPYFHFLQPNQYVEGQKPIGAAEQRVALLESHAWCTAVRGGYRLLQARGQALGAAGERFFDLTGIFRDHPEPLYSDTCCHLTQQGYELLARRIAATIRGVLELQGDALRELRVAPEQLRFDDPLGERSLRVVGVGADGHEHEITAAGFGTAITAADPARLTVGSDGSVRALRRGSTELLVRHGDRRVIVPVTAAWPDVVVGDDVVAGAGAGPRLGLLGDVAATAGTARVRCSGLPATGLRVLATALRPIPATLPNDPRTAADVTTLLPGGAGGTVDGEVPWPAGPDARDRPVFARVLVVGVDGQSIVAASNTLVLTRG